MADLTLNSIPKATGATQIDDSSLSDDGTNVSAGKPIASTYVNASVIGAAIVNAGTGGTPGAATVTGTTGTGTKFQAAVTIGAGGTIESVDSISVAGSYTVPPADVANEPVTGGGLTAAALALGMIFAPSIVGSDAASGLSFSLQGAPGLTFNSTTFLSYEAEYGGISATGNDGANFTLTTIEGTEGSGTFIITGYNNQGVIISQTSEGVRGAPTIISGPQPLATWYIQGYLVGNYDVGAAIIFEAASDWRIAEHNSTKMRIQTQGDADGLNDRFVIDGSGNIKQQNGVFALDTGGNDAGVAISALPGSPTLGMMAVVNNALAPAVGSAVAATGSAKALVWWNGTQWTVMGV